MQFFALIAYNYWFCSVFILFLYTFILNLLGQP